MIISHPDIAAEIALSPENTAVLTIEAPELYAKLLTDLKCQIYDNEPGQFVLSEHYEPLPLAKQADLILSPLLLEFNQKKVINRILAELDKIAAEGDYLEKTAHLQKELIEYFEAITRDLNCPLIWNDDPSASEIAKAVGLKIDNANLLLPEQLLLYMQIMTEFKLAKVFVVVGLKDYLSHEQLTEFYHMVRLKKYIVLLIEAHQGWPAKEYEKRLVIDRDLCEIINDFLNDL